MASQPPPQGSPDLAQRKKAGLFSPELVDLLVSPIKVGAWTGTAGVLAGVGAAIARDTSPFVTGMVTGTQWFTLGSAFWFSRILVMRTWGAPEQMKSSDRIIISAIAGSTTGAISGLSRTPVKILPAMIMWGLMGAGGQMLVNRYQASKLQPKQDDGKGFWARLNPLRKLTDEEYMDMMREKKLKLDVDISLIDDRIAELRAQEHRAREAERAMPPQQK